jgi:hypothetical protein
MIAFPTSNIFMQLRTNLVAWLIVWFRQLLNLKITKMAGKFLDLRCATSG